MYRAKTNIWNMDYTDNFEKVCSYLDKTGKKLLKIVKNYNEVKEVLKKYIEITNIYSTQVTSLALKLFPNSDSVEGKLIQVIQSILLFSTEALDNLVKQTQEIIKNFKANKESNSSGLDDLSKIYQTNFSNVVRLYCTYISENELYEKYLIHKELDILNNKNKIEKNDNKNIIENKTENKKEITSENKSEKESFNYVVIETEQTEKGINKEKIIDKNKEIKLNKKINFNNKEGKESDTLQEENRKQKEKINKKQTIKENKEKAGENDKDKIKENNKEQSNTILYDNHENIIKCEKEYKDFVKKVNIFIKKLVEFGLNEERIINNDFYNNCKKFIDKLLECVDIQNKKYLDQLNLIKDLNEKINSEKVENFYLETRQYSLHSLSIYMNKKSNKKAPELSQKGEFDNELYKQLEIENIGNIINTMQKNGINIKKEDLENYEAEKNISFIENNIKLIFSNDSDISEEGKNKIIEFFKKDKEYILFFLQKMNNDRAKGGKILNIKTYHCIGELFKFVNNVILDKNDFDCFKYISILSMTYYRMDGRNKIYIYEYIKDHPYFQKIDFWIKYLETLVEFDVNNNLYKNNQDTEENKKDEKEEQFKVNFAAFSNVLTVINNMTDFGLNIEFIENFVSLIKNKYTFRPDQIEQFTYLLTIYKEKNKTQQTPIENNMQDKKEEINENINKNLDVNEDKIIEQINQNNEIKND